MRLLLFLPYAWNTSPSQRYRIEQWSHWLGTQGVQVEARTLLTPSQQRLLYGSAHPGKKAWMLLRSISQRLFQLYQLRKFDVIWLHRTALPIGPPILERVLARSGRPIVYEFDDAIYLANTAAANARWSFLKCASKTADICRMAAAVVVGNETLADFARQHNDRVAVVPSTVDPEQYHLRSYSAPPDRVVIGWSGSPTTVAHLETISEALRRVAASARVEIRVVGAQWTDPRVPVSVREWSAEREARELEAFDIGVMPLPDDPWTRGKCAMKALLYMAAGVPAVASPVGVNADLIHDGVNGLLAGSEDEWVSKLTQLVENPTLRQSLGMAGRATVEQGYSLQAQAPRVLELLRSVA